MAIGMASLPVGAGLGSSAALSVATAAALIDVYSKLAYAGGDGSSGIVDAASPSVTIGGFGEGWHPVEASRGVVNDWAFAAETLFHGNPSGLDNTVSTYGAGATRLNMPLCTVVVVVVCDAHSGWGGRSPLCVAGCRYGGALAYVNSPRRMERIPAMPTLRLLITNTKVPKNTKALVAGESGAALQRPWFQPASCSCSCCILVCVGLDVLRAMVSCLAHL